jgi:hypothetical protein
LKESAALNALVSYILLLGWLSTKKIPGFARTLPVAIYFIMGNFFKKEKTFSKAVIFLWRIIFIN